MDKNKSRTDLLSAGRKKLQQFRQKKDGKGSGSGKSTKKSSKSEKHEADADAVSSATKPTALTQAPEGETESRVDANLENINSSGSHSGEISTASDIEVASAAPSAVPITHEGNAVETLIDKNAELASQEVAFSQHDVNFSATNEGESTVGTDAEEARVSSLDTSHVMDSGGLAKDANMSMPVDVSMQPISVDNTDQTKGRDEEPLPSPESINTSLVQEREDQGQCRQLTVWMQKIVIVIKKQKWGVKEMTRFLHLSLIEVLKVSLAKHLP